MATRPWQPATFVERIGAALAAPRVALRAADRAGSEGRTAGDATTLVLLSFLAVHLREVVAAVWIGTLEGPGVGLALVLGVASRVLAMKLVVLFGAAVVLTIVAGRSRSLGRDFDLACVALVPYVAVELIASALAQVAAGLGFQLGDLFQGAAGVAAYGWAAVVLLLAWQQTRERRAKAGSDSGSGSGATQEAVS